VLGASRRTADYRTRDGRRQALRPTGTDGLTVECRARLDRILATMIDVTFLTTEEVIKYLHVNLRTVYRLIKTGEIPAVRVGRQWRFRRRDIDAWLDHQGPNGGERITFHPDPQWPRSVARTSRPRVLVVDDDASSRDLLSKALALAEYQIDLATNGLSAVERMHAVPYDLLVVELKVPGMDGLSVIREAKRLSPNLPVIIITGFSTESSAIEAVNLGVVGYLTKPFRAPQVLAAATKALGE